MTINNLWILILAALLSTSCWAFVPTVETTRRGVPLYYRDCHDAIAQELHELIVTPSPETQWFVKGLLLQQPTAKEEEIKYVTNMELQRRQRVPSWNARGYRPNMIADYHLKDDLLKPGPVKEHGPDHAWTHFRQLPKELGPDHAWTHFQLQHPGDSAQKIYGPDHAWTYFRFHPMAYGPHHKWTIFTAPYVDQDWLDRHT